jgi:hypothetical protein
MANCPTIILHKQYVLKRTRRIRILAQRKYSISELVRVPYMPKVNIMKYAAEVLDFWVSSGSIYAKSEYYEVRKTHKNTNNGAKNALHHFFIGEAETTRGEII